MDSSSSSEFPCREISSFTLIDLPQNQTLIRPILNLDENTLGVKHVGDGIEHGSDSKQQDCNCDVESKTIIQEAFPKKEQCESLLSQSSKVTDETLNKCKHSHNHFADEDQLPPELHAICLLALFHVNFVCGICNEALIDCICLECGHNFCALCIQQWLAFNRVCPTCYQLVKEDFGGQRTYCVDEFVAEMYTSIQELTQEYFGNTLKPEPPNPPELHPTASQIQASIRNTRILNTTPSLYRQHLKVLRRNFMQLKHPGNDRNDFSLLEQQTELFGGPDSLTLSTVVQFFLSSITAYITYEGGDGIDNDVILVGAISVLVWCTAFLTLMRLLGYDGSFSDLVTYLTFVQFVETAIPVEEVPEENLMLSSDDSDLNNTTSITVSPSEHNIPSPLFGETSFASHSTGSDVSDPVIELRSSNPVPTTSVTWNCEESLNALFILHHAGPGPSIKSQQHRNIKTEGRQD